MNRPFDARKVARGTMDRCCAGDPLPTAWNLLRVLVVLAALAVHRGATRVWNQPRRTLKWGVW